MLDVTKIAQALIDGLEKNVTETPAMIRGIALLHQELLLANQALEAEAAALPVEAEVVE